MSGKIGIIVQARMSSKRLPGKSLIKIGERPLLFYVVQRLKLLDLPVIVCTSDHASDDVLAEYLKAEEISFYRGSLENVLERYIESAEAFKVDNVVRVTADNAFVDIDYLQESLPLFGKYDYVDGIYEKGLIPGVGFELVKTSELKRIPSKQKRHLEHVTLWLRKHTGESEQRIQLPPNQVNKYSGDVRLTCDYPEDLELLQRIFKHFDYRFDVPVKEILGFLKKKPFP